MSRPIVFISHLTVREGAAEGLRRLWAEVSADLERTKGRTLVFAGYLSDDGSRLTIVHLFADAAALVAHVQGAAERTAAVTDLATPAGWEIYGPAPAGFVAEMRAAAAAAKVPLSLAPGAMDGFIRLAPDARG